MSVTVKGLDSALKNLDKQEDIVIDAVKDILVRVATDIEFEATLNAPNSYQIGDKTINLSFIGQKINKKAHNNSDSNIISNRTKKVFINSNPKKKTKKKELKETTP